MKTRNTMNLHFTFPEPPNRQDESGGLLEVTRFFGTWFLTSALLFAATAAHSFDPSIPNAPSPEALDQLWSETLDRADSADLENARQVLASFRNPTASLSDVCTLQSAALDASLRRLPVSLALQQQALQCAEAMAQEADATRREAWVAALLKRMLAGERGSEPLRPATLLLIEDADTMAALSGKERIGDYYRLGDHGQQLIRVLTLVEPKTRPEQSWYFDVSAASVALSRQAPNAGFPGHRVRTVLNLLNSRQQANDRAMILSRSAALGLGWLDEAKPAAMLLIEMALAGEQDAAIAAGEVCLARPQLRCEKQAVDALLTFGKASSARALVTLAAMNAAGAGIRKNRQHAEVLLNRAHDRVDTVDLMFWYAHLRSYGVLWTLDERGDRQRVGRSIISQRNRREVNDAWEAVVQRGHAEAQLAFAEAIAEMVDQGGIREARFMLADLAKRGYPEGLAALAEFDYKQGVSPNLLRADLVRAHELGSSRAPFLLYQMLRQRTLQPEAGESSQAYLLAAAHRGEPEAIQALLKQPGDLGGNDHRAYWLHSLAMLDDRDGLIAFLDLLRRQNDMPVFLADDALWLSALREYRDDAAITDRRDWLNWRWSNQAKTREQAQAALEQAAGKSAALWLELGQSIQHGTARLPSNIAKAKQYLERSAALGNQQAKQALAQLQCQPADGTDGEKVATGC